jgi:acyl dehydratase
VLGHKESRVRRSGFTVPIEDRHFEDYVAGSVHEFGSIAVEEEEVVSFGKRFVPLPYHTDPDLAKRSIYGGLIASGWHTAAMTMRLFVQTLNFTEGAIGLGVDELRWPNAVRPGDTLRVETEIVDLRPSRSKPSHGIVRLRNVTTNQRGEIVQTMTASAMIPQRKADNKTTDHRTT